jgi:hypothetical protein
MTALLGKFPATVWLVGSPFVTEAARRYIRQRPPRKPCIAEYGEDFPEFISSCAAVRPLSGRPAPYLRDFATLEWLVGQIAIAVDQPPLPVEALSSIPGDALPNTVLILQTGLHYFHDLWPVDELITLYLTDTAPETFVFEPADVWIEIRGARSEFHLNRLTPGEFIFRKTILGGQAIADAADAALNVESGFEADRALVALFADRLVTASKPRAPEQS